MKKILALLIVFALTLSLCGCSLPFLNNPQTNGPTPSEPVSSDNVPSKGSASKVESSEPEKEDKKNEDVLLVCPMEGSQYVTASITMKSDSTFDMQVNLYEGFGNLKGTYEKGEYGVITFNVTEKDFSGFAGDTVQAFELQPSGDGYKICFLDVEFIGALNEGAVFTKE